MVKKKTPQITTLEQAKRKQNLSENSSHVWQQEIQRDALELPLLPVRNTVLLPNVVTPLLVGRDQSIKAIEDAMSKDRSMFVVTQLNEGSEDPGPDDLYTIGVEGIIDRVLKMPDGTTSILIHGQQRLRRIEYTQQTPFMRVRAEIVEEEIERTLAVEALVRAVLALFEKCVKLSRT